VGHTIRVPPNAASPRNAKARYTAHRRLDPSHQSHTTSSPFPWAFRYQVQSDEYGTTHHIGPNPEGHWRLARLGPTSTPLGQSLGLAVLAVLAVPRPRKPSSPLPSTPTSTTTGPCIRQSSMRHQEYLMSESNDPSPPLIETSPSRDASASSTLTSRHPLIPFHRSKVALYQAMLRLSHRREPDDRNHSYRF
jgi:hypothetical protein